VPRCFPADAGLGIDPNFEGRHYSGPIAKTLETVLLSGTCSCPVWISATIAALNQTTLLFIVRSINFHIARYLISAPSLEQCPANTGAEVAFAGRSNAGKSSAINALCNNSKLARTSKTPGRTQMLNFFSIDDNTRIVDLPGYGYAKVPLEMKKQWQEHLFEYLQQRQCLQGLVIVMDVRHPLQELDAELLNWAVGVELPVHLLLTKADKLKPGQAKATLLKMRRHLADAQVDDLVSVQLYSALKKQGLEELRAQLGTWLVLEDSRELS